MTKPKKLRDSRMEADTDERLIDPVKELTQILDNTPNPTESELMQQMGTDFQGLAEQLIEEAAKARRYVPPQCSLCTELRKDDKADYTRVVSTQRETGLIVRYCKCGFCGNTFKDLERV